ncbi:MAG TPA: hypothetical protein VNI20_07095 [Fimbriimonadaceae bacterium]|nr:hypothetical protein [Fimbriimonadaceae bacterium]
MKKLILLIFALSVFSAFIAGCKSADSGTTTDQGGTTGSTTGSGGGDTTGG